MLISQSVIGRRRCFSTLNIDDRRFTIAFGGCLQAHQERIRLPHWQVCFTVSRVYELRHAQNPPSCLAALQLNTASKRVLATTSEPRVV